MCARVRVRVLRTIGRGTFAAVKLVVHQPAAATTATAAVAVAAAASGVCVCVYVYIYICL